MNNKSKYVIDLFRRIYQVPSKIKVNYGAYQPSGVAISSSGVLENAEFSIDYQTVIWKEWVGEQIPFLFDSEDSELFTRSDFNIKVNFDVIASAFYFLSSWQEKIYFAEQPEDGRFPYINSIQHKLGIPHIPVVNYYFDIIRNAIEQFYGIALKPSIKPEHKPSVFLSHDIDVTGKAWLIGSYHELRKGKIASALNLLSRKFIQGKDAWLNLDEILHYEYQDNIRSTFFLIPRKGKYEGIQNADYDLTSKKFQQQIESIEENNCEVALHGSSGTHYNAQRFSEDLHRLNQGAIGNRFHFLKYDVIKTPALLQYSGVKYDSTLGFAEHYGFRNGFCFPFNLYDIENDKPLDVVEIPLIFMDATMRQKNYMNLSKPEILKAAETILRETKKFNGIFSLLWHNTYFSEYKYTGWKEILDDLIRLLKSENFQFQTGKEIANNFNNLNQLR